MRIDEVEFAENLLAKDSSVYPKFSKWEKLNLSLCETAEEALAVIALHEHGHRIQLANTLHEVMRQTTAGRDLVGVEITEADSISLLLVLVMATPLGKAEMAKFMKNDLVKASRKSKKKK